MELHLARIEEHLSSNSELDTSMDKTDSFINISVRCIETDAVVTRSINLKELARQPFDHTQSVIEDIDTMKDHVLGIY